MRYVFLKSQSGAERLIAANATLLKCLNFLLDIQMIVYNGKSSSSCHHYFVIPLHGHDETLLETFTESGYFVRANRHEAKRLFFMNDLEMHALKFVPKKVALFGDASQPFLIIQSESLGNPRKASPSPGKDVG